jgi:3-hydroxypropanoate dehydrogenase
MPTIDDSAFDLLFRQARTQNGFLDRPVSDDLLRRLYDVTRMGPTSMNCQPMRLVFVRTPEGKARMLPALSPGNVDKVKQAPVTAIIATDTRFYEEMDSIWHAKGAGEGFAKNPALAEATAFRNGTLQGAYLMIVARGLGLDCGPMSGFDAAKLNAAFFPDGRLKANFLCNLGYGDPSKVMNRNRRFDFDEVCTLL